MSSMRAFLAVNLAVPIVEQIRTLQGQLKAWAREQEMRVAWVPPPNMHVTLRFLGDVPRESGVAIADQLRGPLAAWGPVQLEVATLGVFPDAQKPRVLWVGVKSPEDRLGALVQQVEQGLETLGFEPEKRPFHAHLTLGRIKQGRDVEPLLQQHGDVSFGVCTVGEVVLYESKLFKSGAEYNAVVRLPLTGHGG